MDLRYALNIELNKMEFTYCCKNIKEVISTIINTLQTRDNKFREIIQLPSRNVYEVEYMCNEGYRIQKVTNIDMLKSLEEKLTTQLNFQFKTQEKPIINDISEPTAYIYLDSVLNLCTEECSYVKIKVTCYVYEGV